MDRNADPRDIAAFRSQGHAVIDWIADYWERVGDLPVQSQLRPGAVRERLPASAPEMGEAFEDILADVDQILLPGITHWQSPKFFAFFPANNSGASVLGDSISSGLGVQGMVWATSPSCTELEMAVMDWLVEAMGLPGAFSFAGGGGGVIQDSASSANLCAVIAARERATGLASNRTGGDGGLIAYASTETHSSVEKGIRVAGIGSENLRIVGVDDNLAMRPDLLEAEMQRDRAAGRVPFFVCGTVGTTSSQAMDPLPGIGEICRREGVWLHVDAAMAGAAALCPEYRHFQAGLELADSYCFDPHKWLFVNFDCSCFWVRRREDLIDALAIPTEYLPQQDSEQVLAVDYRDWHVPLGRRFRSLKLWFVLRQYGLEVLRNRMREHISMTQALAGWIASDPRFEVVAPVPLNLICFRHRGGDEANAKLLAEVNASGDLYLSSTRIAGRLTLRLCVGQTRTESRQVEAAWARIQQASEGIEC